MREFVVALIDRGFHVLLDDARRLAIPLNLRQHCTSIGEGSSARSAIGKHIEQADRSVLCISRSYLKKIRNSRSFLYTEAEEAFTADCDVVWFHDCKGGGKLGQLICRRQRTYTAYYDCHDRQEFFNGRIDHIARRRPITGATLLGGIVYLANRHPQINEVAANVYNPDFSRVFVCIGGPGDRAEKFAEHLADIWLPLCEAEEGFDTAKGLARAIRRLTQSQGRETWERHAEIWDDPDAIVSDPKRFWDNVSQLTRFWPSAKGEPFGLTHLHINRHVWRKHRVPKTLGTIVAARPASYRPGTGKSILFISIEDDGRRFFSYRKTDFGDALHLPRLKPIGKADIEQWREVVGSVAEDYGWGHPERINDAVERMLSTSSDHSLEDLALALRPAVTQAAQAKVSG